MKNNLLQYDIDYSLLDNKEVLEVLESYNIMPIKKEALYLLVATSDIDQDINNIRMVFNQAVKFIEVEQRYLEFEWKYLKSKNKEITKLITEYGFDY